MCRCSRQDRTSAPILVNAAALTAGENQTNMRPSWPASLAAETCSRGT